MTPGMRIVTVLPECCSVDHPVVIGTAIVKGVRRSTEGITVALQVDVTSDDPGYASVLQTQNQGIWFIRNQSLLQQEIAFATRHAKTV